MLILLAIAAHAAPPPIASLHVSADPEAWYAEQRPFDAADAVSIFIRLDDAEHEPFWFSAECELAHVATGATLTRVHVPPVHLERGVDAVRTAPFRAEWPNSAVALSCAPDHDPTRVHAVTLPPSLFSPDRATAGPERAPAPPPETPEPEPVSPADEPPPPSEAPPLLSAAPPPGTITDVPIRLRQRIQPITPPADEVVVGFDELVPADDGLDVEVVTAPEAPPPDPNEVPADATVYADTP